MNAQLFQKQKDLKLAQEMVPVLVELLDELKTAYREQGYQDVQYTTMGSNDSYTAATGIEKVGPAVADSGPAAGIWPSNNEALVMGAFALFRQLGKAAFKRAFAKSYNQIGGEAAVLKPYHLGGGHHIPAKKAFEGAEGYFADAVPGYSE